MQASNDYIVVRKEATEEKRSSGGIILNVSDLFDFKDEFSKKNVIKCEVVYDNPSIPYIKAGDRILVNPQKGTKAVMDWDELNFITKDQYIAKIEKDGTYIVPPDCVMVKINVEDREALYTRWIVRNDGSKIQLFIQPDYSKDTTQRSKIFVNVGEIMQIGADVNGIEIGDVAILDYTIDNDIDNVLYFDEHKNKYVVVQAETVLHQYDEWAYATRNSPRDQKVSASGDIKTISPILGLLRNNILIARFPYVFLEHKNTLVRKESALVGIVYEEHEYILERKVLSVSDKSRKKYGIRENQMVILQDPDMFDVQLKESKIQAIMDSDIMIGYVTES